MIEDWKIQGSEEWKYKRRKSITASDASVLISANPWKTPLQLWKEKLDGIETPVNAAMQRGTDLEPEARADFEDISGIPMYPDVVVHPKRPWMMASLDGISFDRKQAVEIKCPGEKAHLSYLDGELPDMYKAQMTHQMLVTHLQQIYFFSYHPKFEPALMIYTFDFGFACRLLRAEIKFYHCLISRTAPCDGALDASRLALVEQYKEVTLLLKGLEKEQEELKGKIVNAFGRPYETEGFKLTKVVSPGRIDYKKVPQLEGLDLEPYRGKDIESWRISI